MHFYILCNLYGIIYLLIPYLANKASYVIYKFMPYQNAFDV